VPMWFGLLRAIPVSGEVAQRELPVQTRLSKRAVRQPLHAPVNTLNANWAYMTMAALAWTLKAWSALLLPVTPPLGRTTQRTTPALPHHGVPNLPPSVHRDPLPNRHHRPTRALARPRPQPIAHSILPPDRHPLNQPTSNTPPRSDHRPHTPGRAATPNTAQIASHDTHPRHPHPATAIRNAPSTPTAVLKLPHRHVEPSPGRSRPVNRPRTPGIACFRARSSRFDVSRSRSVAARSCCKARHRWRDTRRWGFPS
jgi:hypothetical protein